jgi:hypothetical protein
VHPLSPAAEDHAPDHARRRVLQHSGLKPFEEQHDGCLDDKCINYLWTLIPLSSKRLDSEC